MKHVKGNVLDNVIQGVIVHQVNCQGVMGSGIAKEIRERWPVVFQQYQLRWKSERAADTQGASLLGQVQWVAVGQDLWVVNLFGQQFYGRDGRRYTSYDALDDGFKTIAWMLRSKGFEPKDVHHPLVGCGLGGGKWPVVEAIIQSHLGDETTLWTLE